MRRRFEWRLSVQTSFLHLGPQIDWGQSRVPPSADADADADDRRFRMPLTTAAAAALLSLITSLTKRDVRRRRRSIIRGRDNGHFLIMENQYRRWGKDKWEGVNKPANQHDHMPDHMSHFPRYLRFKSLKLMHLIVKKGTPAPLP